MKSTSQVAVVAIAIGAVAGAALGYWEARPWEADVVAALSPSDAEAARDAKDAAPPAGSGAVAVAPETVFVFGKMETGTTKRHAFPIRNAGDAPLTVTFLSHTCKCTSVELGGKSVEPQDFVTVPPGGETLVELEWAAKVAPGPFRHGADFSTSDPRNSRIEIHVEGEIVDSTMLMPAQLSFGTIRAGEQGRAELFVMSFLEPEVKIESSDVREPELAKYLKVEIQPVSQADLPDPNALAAAKVVAVYDARGGVGPFGGSIRLATNLAKAPKLEIPVFGSVKGDISLFGRGWLESMGLLRMSPMTSAAGGSTRLNVTIRGEHANSTELKLARVEPPEMKVALGERRQLGEHLVQQQLTIEIPAGTRPMVRAGEDQGGDALIVLSSSHPSTPEVRLRVNFTVKP